MDRPEMMNDRKIKSGRTEKRSLTTIFWIMAKIGCFTFGGGWSIVAQMQHEFVENRGWLTEEQIVDYLSLARSFPGIMIINMSVMCGYSMAGVAGAVAAAFGLSAPALVAIAIVTYFYSSLKNNVYVEKILTGVRCVVVPIILQAAWKLKGSALISKASYLLMGIAFVICAFTSVSKPLVIIAGVVLGLIIWGGAKNEDAA